MVIIQTIKIKFFKYFIFKEKIQSLLSNFI